MPAAPAAGGAFRRAAAARGEGAVPGGGREHGRDGEGRDANLRV